MFNARRASISGCVAAVLAGGVLCRVEAQQPPAALSVPSVVNRYCVSCHNDRLKSGGLALATVGSHEVAQDPDVWEKVLRKVRARQMPPIGTPRPDDATYEAVIASLETSLDRAAAAAPNPGR